MIKFSRRLKFKIFSKKSLLILMLLSLAIIPIRLTITSLQVGSPQAILILGGDLDRFPQGAKFAQLHPDLDIWISCAQKQRSPIERVLNQTEINQDKVYYDLCPTDTVTNFTCSLKPLSANHIRYVYLLTSDYHLPRAVAIATLVFGSRGLAFHPVSLPSQEERSESWLRILRDCLRCLFWLLTGKTGASL